MKDEFLATLAHELRNPLAPIRTGVQLIRRAGNNSAILEKTCPVMERQLEQVSLSRNGSSRCMGAR